MKKKAENDVQVRHEDIAELAKKIWESEDRQVGRDLEYWLRAERELLSGRNCGSNAPTNPAEPSENRHGPSRTIKLPDLVTKLTRT
jgi:hypothetical protein